MLATVRLDPETARALERVARETGQTKSEVIREAITELAARRRAGPKPAGPYDIAMDLIGIARGGPPDLSLRTGDAFRRLLLRKRNKGG
jgi:hypothetical protein